MGRIEIASRTTHTLRVLISGASDWCGDAWADNGHDPGARVSVDTPLLRL